MRLAGLSIASFVGIVVGCGGASSSTPRCPNSSSGCLTNEVCTFDAKRGCQVCHCDAPVGEPIEKEKPAGTPGESP